ncbi:hypothetical protein P3TCK_26090 [Photobacterium profundum 3TCK]|uniref:Uncharacterized protein n=1 Tax=Photobacterium profundum 3TCK TaxID=314280 RepID=Q1Z284_9GAMM|nr:hypothetical protein P3TCK_26090 [Photobacterium profundum 3TCK]
MEIVVFTNKKATMLDIKVAYKTNNKV